MRKEKYFFLMRALSRNYILILFFVLLLTLVSCASPTQMQRASMDGDLNAVRAFLESGVDVNERARGRWGDHMGSRDGTALHVAAHFGQTDVMRLLIEKGANVNAKGAFGITPLWEAIWKGQVGAIRLLLDSGADPELADRDGDTPIDWTKNHWGSSRLGNQVVSMLEEAIEKRYGAVKKSALPPLPQKKISLAPDTALATQADIVTSALDFGSYHALIVGNNDYRHLPKLRTAVNDAKAMAVLLQDKYDFRDAP
jgi:hypothetical protein